MILGATPPPRRGRSDGAVKQGVASP